MGLSVVLLGVLCSALWMDLSTARLQGCLPGGGVDNTKLSADQQEAQQSQTHLSCHANLTGREHFIDDVLAEMGRTRAGWNSAS